MILIIKWYSYYESAIFNWTQRSNICKGYGFLSFAKNIGKIFNSAKKSKIDAIKINSKRVIHKTAEATDDLIGNKTASLPKESSQNDLETDENETEIPKKRCVSPEKRQQVID